MTGRKESREYEVDDAKFGGQSAEALGRGEGQAMSSI